MRLLAKCAASCFILGVLGLVAFGPSAGAQDKKKKVELKVKVGDTAPSFESVDDAGKPFKSADVVGKKVLVLYFYPADFTGGCTKQACGFRDDIEKFKSKGVLVVGVSGDSVANHKLFKEDYQLTFPLLADEKGEVAKVFGIPTGAGGTATGKKSGGDAIKVTQGVRINRYTIVIDKAGKIAAADAVGDAGGDAKRIVELIKKLDTK
jgi:peroxiredoxin Q/BCP